MKVTGPVFNWSTLLESPTDPYDPITNRRLWEFDGPTVTGNGTPYPVSMGVAELCLWLRRANEVTVEVTLDTSFGTTVIGATAGFGTLPTSEATVYLGGVRYLGHGSPAASMDFGSHAGNVPSLVHVGSGAFSEEANWFPYLVFGAGGVISTLTGIDTPDVAPFTFDISITDPLNASVYSQSITLYCPAGQSFTGTNSATMVATGFWPYT